MVQHNDARKIIDFSILFVDLFILFESINIIENMTLYIEVKGVEKCLKGVHSTNIIERHYLCGQWPGRLFGQSQVHLQNR